jgi:hypothetical protein
LDDLDQLLSLWHLFTSSGNYWDASHYIPQEDWKGQDEHIAWYLVGAQLMMISKNIQN